MKSADTVFDFAIAASISMSIAIEIVDISATQRCTAESAIVASYLYLRFKIDDHPSIEGR